MRKKKNIDKRLEECNELIITKETIPDGGVSTLFSKTQKLYLEIGCGKRILHKNVSAADGFLLYCYGKGTGSNCDGLEKAKLTG
jgi:hypothetical protein